MSTVILNLSSQLDAARAEIAKLQRDVDFRQGALREANLRNKRLKKRAKRAEKVLQLFLDAGEFTDNLGVAAACALNDAERDDG